jgi:alpha-1,2-mannosyltransferase
LVGILISAIQLAGAAFGFWWIRRVALSDQSDRHVLRVSFVLSALMAGFVFAATPVSPNLSDLREHILFQDFHEAYWAAGRALLAGPEGLRTAFEQGVNGFVSLPVTAFAFLPFGAISNWKAAAIVFSLIGVAAVLLSWRMICDRCQFDRFERAAALFAAACFGPLLYSAREGNISHLLLPPILWGMALLDARRDALAGVVFGVLAVFKPPLALIGVYLFLRGRFRSVAGAAVAGAALGGLSLAIFGWDTHLVWYREAIAPYARGPIAAFNAQSIASFIARFETGLPGYADWTPRQLSQTGAVLVWIGALAVMALGVWAALTGPRGRRPEPADTECELHLILLTACLVSTLSWSHYFVWLLPAFAFLYTRARTEPALMRAGVAAFVLMAPVEYLNNYTGWSAASPVLNLIISHRMLGGLILLAALVWTRRRDASVRQPAAAGASPASLPDLSL